MRILHLSDIHFGGGHRWGNGTAPIFSKSISEIFEKNEGILPNLIVVSGDFTSKGSVDEFEAAKQELLNLCLASSISDSLMDFIFVPGNHDLPWKNSAGKNIKKNERDVNYRNFYLQFQEEFSNTKNRTKNKLKISASLKKEIQKNSIDYAFFEKGTFNTNYLIVGLNSVMIDSEKDQGKGYFGWEQLRVFDKLCAQSTEFANNELFIVVVFHHHVIPVSYIERDYFLVEDGKISRKCSITLDAKEALDHFRENSVSLLLHGHQHQPASVLWRDNTKKPYHALQIVAAGSAGSPRSDLGDIALNHFFVHEISSQSISTINILSDPNNNDKFQVDLEKVSVPLITRVETEYESCNLAHLPPENSIYVELISPYTDISNLYYLFLNVVDCKESRIIILDELNSSESIDMCGIYDLYGRYDVLIKFRERKPREGDRFLNKVRQALISHKQDSQNGSYHFLDITNEIPLFNPLNKKDNNKKLIISDSKAYENSTWSSAFLEILLSGQTNPDLFLEELSLKMRAIYDKEKIDLSRIIRSIVFRNNDNILLEILMSCRDFPLLTRLSTIIEEITNPRRIDKFTHLVYFLEEYSA